MNPVHRNAAPEGARTANTPLSALGGLLGTLLRLAAGVLAFVLMLGALLVGAALALGLVVWALLRGRRPQAQVFNTSFQRMRRQRATGQAGAPSPGHAQAARPGAVIDIEAREVPDDGRPTATLRPDR